MSVGTSRVWMPESIEQAWSLKEKFGEDACYVAGSTSLQLRWEEQRSRPGELISLEYIELLSRRHVRDTSFGPVLEIGACVTLGDLLRDTVIRDGWPLLVRACGAIGAPALRNRATLIGNICQGRGDSIPALLVMEAKLNLYTEGGVRMQGIDAYLSLLEGANSGRAMQLVQSILVPQSQDSAGAFFCYRKVGRRETFSVALVTVAGYVQRGGGGEIRFARFAIGGGEHRPQRLQQTERAVEGQFPSRHLWKQVHACILDEVQSYSDAFASDGYRRQVAANVLVAQLAAKMGSESEGTSWN